MTDLIRDLEDQTKACVYISPEDHLGEDDISHQPYSPFLWRDLPDGHELRLQAYKEAWKKCLERMLLLIRSLHASIAEEIVAQIRTAYTETLPGLPYPELPVIAISAGGGDFSLYADIMEQLEDPPQLDRDIEEDDEFRIPIRTSSAMVTHIYPAECPNLSAMMKAIITGFVDQSGIANSGGKRRPAASLAMYDITLLQSWYDNLGNDPNLVVFLHDFEQFDPAVVQDVLYICSLHIPQLPLVIVLSMSSPPTPSYLHKTYPRSTLALLRVHTFRAPSGTTVVEQVISKTFFDPNFDPRIMLGPAAIQFLADFAYRSTASFDALLTIVQLAHMKHFTEPLTVFVNASRLGSADVDLTYQMFEQPASRPFLDALRSRNPNSVFDPDDLNASEPDLPSIIEYVDDARVAFHQKARKLRVALSVARIAREIAPRQPEAKEGDVGGLTFVSAVMRGRAIRELRYLSLVVKKLATQRLRSLLQALLDFFNNLEDANLREEEDQARVRIQNALAQLPEGNTEVGHTGVDILFDARNTSREPAVAQVAEALGEWLLDYLEERLVRLDEGALWDIWYTGSTPFPSELINPAPRPTIVSALAYPYAFASVHTRLLRSQEKSSSHEAGEHNYSTESQDSEEAEDDNGRTRALWELPDTSILFWRYAEAGRMVNVYDWFQSFATVLESQRRRLRRPERMEKESKSKGTPQRPNTNGKINGIQTTERKRKERAHAQVENGGSQVLDQDIDPEDEMDVDEDAQDENEEAEAWNLEMQARFIRALHELDHMGFVTQTGRKADHVVRAVFDVID